MDDLMSIDVRTITDDEVEAFTRAINLGFNNHARPDEAELRRGGIQIDRTHAAFAGGEMIGAARSFPTTLTLPGGATVPVGAVTNVAVVPTHRRQGALTGMMAAQLDDIAARCEPAAILISAEAPIYGRFGYGCASRNATVRLDTGRARFAARAGASAQIRFVDNDGLRKEGPAVFDRFRAQQPGAIARNERWWDFFCGVIRDPAEESVDKRFHALCGDDGWLSYEIKGDWDGRLPANKLEIHDLVASTPEAYAALWYHCLTLDWIATVTASDRPVAEPLPDLLTDPRRAVVTEVTDFLWARLLDVPAALSARSYRGHDRLVIAVVDGFRPEQGGRYRLDVEDGMGTCTATDDDPDVTVTARELGAAWLGGTGLWLAAGAGQVDEHTAGAVRRFDDLFLTNQPPWCNTWF